MYTSEMNVLEAIS